MCSLETTAKHVTVQTVTILDGGEDMNGHDRLIDIREAARRLGTGKYTVKKLLRAGELRTFLVNREIRISPADLRELSPRAWG